MTRGKTLACSAGLIAIAVAPVAADPQAPSSLRMRARPSVGSTWSPMRWLKRVAQVPPAGDPPASPVDPAAPTGDPAARTSPPAQGQPGARPASAEKPGALSDEELARLAEQESDTEPRPVVGTLIHRGQVDAPSLVSVIDRETLLDAGLTNVGDVLQRIPAQGNAVNGQNNAGDGATRINLRSLGAARTLVLLNGRRLVPSGVGADSSVDLGTIPLAMIERVEVLKDGAAAIYGSDAIAGVVNVITRNNINGTEATAYSSTSNNGDGTSFDLSFVTGHSSRRGNVTFSGGYQNQKPVMASDRDFSRQTYTYDYSCTAAVLERGDCVQTTQNSSPASPSGRINTMPGGGPQLSIVGCNTRYCTADGKGGFRNFIFPSGGNLGDTYNDQAQSYLVTPSTRVNLFSNGSYDITRNTHVFFEGQFNSRKSSEQLSEVSIGTSQTGTRISAGSIYNPFDQDVVDYTRRLVELGPRTITQQVSTTRLVVGLDGAIDKQAPAFERWAWEASYNYGRSDGAQTSDGDVILSHLASALGESHRDAQGAFCGATRASSIPGCVPLDLLHPGPTANSQDAINYLTFTGTQSGFNEQHTALVQASGKLLDLAGHGDIALTLGGDYRFERGGLLPDPLTATGDTTGHAFQPTLGSYHTFEGFGELSIVPIANGAILKWVEIDAEGRVHDDVFGSGATGRLSGLVRALGGIAVRGSYGTAFRAPSISERFSGQADSVVSIEDPCDIKPPSQKVATPLSPMVAAQCLATGVPASSAFGTSQLRARLSGNPAVQPETGTIGTAGVVYEAVPNLDFTLDYWHLDLDDAITHLPVPLILSQCYQAGNNDACDQIHRDPITHAITDVVERTRNIGGVTTSGLDFSAAYRYRNNLGTFRHALEGTYLFQYNLDTGTRDAGMNEQIIHGRGFYDLGVLPDLKLDLLTTWAHPAGVDAGFRVRFIDGYQECAQNRCNDPTNLRRDVSSYTTGDVFVRYRLKTRQGTTSIAAGMNNVVNAQPPIVYNAPAPNADASAYDFLGRQFYLRLGQEF